MHPSQRQLEVSNSTEAARCCFSDQWRWTGISTASPNRVTSCRGKRQRLNNSRPARDACRPALPREPGSAGKRTPKSLVADRRFGLSEPGGGHADAAKLHRLLR